MSCDYRIKFNFSDPIQVTELASKLLKNVEKERYGINFHTMNIFFSLFVIWVMQRQQWIKYVYLTIYGNGKFQSTQFFHFPFKTPLKKKETNI